MAYMKPKHNEKYIGEVDTYIPQAEDLGVLRFVI